MVLYDIAVVEVIVEDVAGFLLYAADVVNGVAIVDDVTVGVVFAVSVVIVFLLIMLVLL